MGPYSWFFTISNGLVQYSTVQYSTVLAKRRCLEHGFTKNSGFLKER